MTTPNGPIVFSSSGTGGSDTQASGLGPATAVFGTGASTNNTTTVDLSADTPDLSGVSAGDMLWLDSTAGPQWSIIASVDDGADTVTCDDTFTQTEGSRTWAIGGKRASLDATSSRLLLSTDAKNNFVIEITEDQTITSSAITLLGSISGALLRSSSAGTKTITQSFDGYGFATSGGWSLYDLKFTNNSSKTSDNCFLASISTNGLSVSLYECHAYDCDGLIKRQSGTSPDARAYNCSSSNCDFGWSVGAGDCLVYNCLFVDCQTAGPDFDICNIHNSIFANSAADGIQLRDNAKIYSCVFYGNADDGIDIISTQVQDLAVIDCIIYGNTGYGIEAIGSWAAGRFEIKENNAFGSNTAGNTDSNADGAYRDMSGAAPFETISLTADPFTDGANNDFTLNNTAGGGTTLRENSYLADTHTMRPFTQWADLSGGGGLLRIGMNGGMNG